ncbi:MAG: porin [Verrucomicrobia bacterium]|nr:porin [Verrucomicrobiota bacterium]
MKNKIIATLVAFGLVGSASAIEINENLSINGFIDTSYTLTEKDAGDVQELGVDEIELNFLFNVGGASGAIHLDDVDAAGGSDVNVEQAFIGYSLENGVSFTIGKYGSTLGFEREDPGGLYTYSRAYSTGVVGNQFNLGDVDSNVYEGIRLGYSSDVFGLGVSLQNDASGEENIEKNELDLELSFTYTGIENLNIGGGYRFANQAANEVDVLNLHATTVMGKFLLGAEYIELQNGGGAGQDLDGWQVIADYDVSDKLGVALRISSNENELVGNSDYEKVTIAPNYSLSDSLGVILEYSDVDDAGIDSNELALELTFTF